MAKKWPDPFPPPACERLRRLAKLREDAILKKKKAEEGRDATTEEINALGKDQDRKLIALKADRDSYQQDIEHYRTAKKHAENLIITTIQEADQLELIETMNAKPTMASLFRESAAAEEEAEDEKPADGEPALTAEPAAA